MQLQILTKKQLLQANEQEVMPNSSYIPPRRNIAYSTVPHTNAATFFIADGIVGVLQDPPQTAIPADPIPGEVSPAESVHFDPVPDPEEQAQELAGLTQRRATLSIVDDTLTISHDEVTQNIYLNGRQVETENN